ncbi:MAG: amino acid ABC transporter ATP-binding protein [Candidatus Sumerlaeaceae bacterium]|nr:amino acid ABC transporter ATP-binding protein [Candidatus Sumerlaeaceae bacterium]
MITIRNLSKRYGDHQVLDGVSLAISKGETVALLGPSGSGKTTLLRCINGLERFDEGEIEVDGIVISPALSSSERQRRVREIRIRCGFVFQQFHLFPHRSTLSNLTLAPIHVKRTDADVAREEGLALLEHVGLAHKADVRPNKLSGGEQQRVAIARALAMCPAYLLYDEPTSSLDQSRAREIWSIMQRLATEGQTQIVVTHQEELTRAIACRVVRMSHGKIGGGTEANPAV